MIKASLSPRQLEVVNHGEGPILVVAGPGSGKTRVLTERVRRLLTEVRGHFRVLALTFTIKAAKEMHDRLVDLGAARQRATISTIHGFCLEMLADRGKPVGVNRQPQIFERASDRRQILLEAVNGDLELKNTLAHAGDSKAQSQRLDAWLRAIGQIKAYPISRAVIEDAFEERLLDAYNASLRASNAYDFDDLLILAYQLLTEHPIVADFYRRLYGYICIDEAQDLNEAQYAVLQALCGTTFRNVLLVGDPNQSIFRFNTSSPRYMELFAEKFHADRIELTENFRSSAAVVHAAQALEPSYTLEGQLAIPGLVQVLVADDEPAESELISQEITRLIRNGHPDVEGPITPGRCAVLGRNRYLLMVVERELRKCEIACYQRVSPTHEYESDLATEFQLALRIYANPGDRFHLAALAKIWGLTLEENLSLDTAQEFRAFLSQWASNQRNPRVVLPSSTRQAVVAESIAAIAEAEARNQRLDLMPGIAILREHADGLEDEPRRAIYNDTEVFRLEWNQYLRNRTASARSIGGFLGQMALGTTHAMNSDGVALLTVHSAKGLEFDVVFVVGMIDGVFPDYRARNNSRAQKEERRNAFVAMTRSRRLLYLSYPRTRMMPWGEVWANQPSPYLTKVARKK